MSQENVALRFVAEIPREHFSKDVVTQVLDQIRERLHNGELSVEDFIVDIPEEDLELIDMVFSIDTVDDESGGGIVAGSLMGLEDMSGYEVTIGDWVEYSDAMLRLRIPVPTSKVVRA